MPVRIQDGSTTDTLKVEAVQRGARVAVVGPPRGQAYAVAGATGAIAAALSANSTIFAMRYDPTEGTKRAHVTRIVLTWAVSTAFTTRTVAGRRLEVQRASAANATGGTAIAAAGKRQSDNAASEFDAAAGGDMRIAATAALSVTSIVFEGLPLWGTGFAGYGALGDNVEYEWEANAQDGPIVIRPGELLVIRNPVAMDAAGVWNLTVHVEWYEAAAP